MSKQEIAGMWLRVSTGAQDEASQEPDVHDWIAKRGYEVGPEYRVAGKSAFHGRQQADLDRALEDMAEGRINVLVAWHPDRIDRRGSEAVFELAARAKEAGGRIEWAGATARHLNEVNVMSNGLLAITSDMARAESEHKSERIRAKHATLRAKGSAIGRPTYGYRIVERDGIKVFAPREDQAAILREARDRYLGGETLDAICEDFNRRGIPSPGKYRAPHPQAGKPCPWYAKTLAGLFRSTSSAGRRQDASGQTIATFEAVFTMSDHKRLVQRLDSRANRQGISPGTSALLTGVIFTDCGEPMYRIKGRTGFKYYARGAKVGADLAGMDTRVSNIFAAMDSPRMVRVLVPGANNSDAIARLREDMAEAVKVGDYARVPALAAEAEELERQDRDEPNPDRWEMQPVGESYAETWQRLTDGERREMLKDSGVRVVYRDETDFTVELPDEHMSALDHRIVSV